jgi:hypothetical protein
LVCGKINSWLGNLTKEISTMSGGLTMDTLKNVKNPQFRKKAFASVPLKAVNTNVLFDSPAADEATTNQKLFI